MSDIQSNKHGDENGLIHSSDMDEYIVDTLRTIDFIGQVNGLCENCFKISLIVNLIHNYSKVFTDETRTMIDQEISKNVKLAREFYDEKGKMN